MCNDDHEHSQKGHSGTDNDPDPAWGLLLYAETAEKQLRCIHYVDKRQEVIEEEYDEIRYSNHVKT